MVWTPSLDVDIGDYTKASDYDLLADNPEYLQVLADVQHNFDVSTGTGYHKAITQLITDAAGATVKDLLTSEWDPASGSAAAGQAIRYILGKMPDSAGNQDIYAALRIIADTVTSTSEEGRLVLTLMAAGTLTDQIEILKNAVRPTTDSALSIGSASQRIATVFTDTIGDSGQALAIAATTVTLPSGFVFSFNAGDITITHSANILAIAGASTGYSWDTGYMAFGAALGATYPYYFSNTKTNDFLMRIDNTVGGGSKGHGLQINFTASSPDDNTYKFFQGSDSTTDRIYIFSDGDLQNHDNSYGGISDVSLKQDIIDARDYWEDWKKIKFRKYRFKGDVEANSQTPYQLGVVAQELEEVFPAIVQDDQLTKLKGVKYSILAVLQGKVLQECIARIEALEGAT